MATTLVLLIGRSDLANHWNRVLGLNQSLGNWQQLYPDLQVVTYSNPPYLNLQATQLLPTLAPYRRLCISVSLLELDRHQTSDILEGVTTLLETASEHRPVEFDLEFERGNPEHEEAFDLSIQLTLRNVHPHLQFATHINSPLKPLLLDGGDNGPEMREDDVDVEEDV